MTVEHVPGFGLGTSGNDEHEACAETVARALEIGYRHVDTAQMYGNEAAVGDGIDRAPVDREDVFVATKVHPQNLAHEDVLATAEESLDRLGLESVDLLYVHWPTGAYDPADTLPAFDRLVDRGLTERVGVSNFTPDLLDEARGILDAPIAANQVECHPFLQQEALRADAREHGYALVAYAPLGRGAILDEPVLVEIAEKLGLSPAQVSLAWLAGQESVVPIPKSGGAHLEENWAAREIALDPEDHDRIAGIDREFRRFDPDDAAWNR